MAVANGGPQEPRLVVPCVGNYGLLRASVPGPGGQEGVVGHQHGREQRPGDSVGTDGILLRADQHRSLDAGTLVPIVKEGVAAGRVRGADS